MYFIYLFLLQNFEKKDAILFLPSIHVAFHLCIGFFSFKLILLSKISWYSCVHSERLLIFLLSSESLCFTSARWFMITCEFHRLCSSRLTHCSGCLLSGKDLFLCFFRILWCSKRCWGWKIQWNLWIFTPEFLAWREYLFGYYGVRQPKGQK